MSIKLFTMGATEASNNMMQQQQAANKANTRGDGVTFHRYVNVYETFDDEEYDRTGARPRQYTLAEISSIVAELRYYKTHDMQVHPDTYISKKDAAERPARRGIVNILSATTIFAEDMTSLIRRGSKVAQAVA